MKEYILDSKYMTSKQELHEHLQTLMKFPSYYGKNLDALYDVLTDIGGIAKGYKNKAWRLWRDLDSSLQRCQRGKS